MSESESEVEQARFRIRHDDSSESDSPSWINRFEHISQPTSILLLKHSFKTCLNSTNEPKVLKTKTRTWNSRPQVADKSVQKERTWTSQKPQVSQARNVQKGGNYQRAQILEPDVLGETRSPGAQRHPPKVQKGEPRKGESETLTAQKESDVELAQFETGNPSGSSPHATIAGVQGSPQGRDSTSHQRGVGSDAGRKRDVRQVCGIQNERHSGGPQLCEVADGTGKPESSTSIKDEGILLHLVPGSDDRHDLQQLVGTTHRGSTKGGSEEGGICEKGKIDVIDDPTTTVQGSGSPDLHLRRRGIGTKEENQGRQRDIQRCDIVDGVGREAQVSTCAQEPNETVDSTAATVDKVSLEEDKAARQQNKNKRKLLQSLQCNEAAPSKIDSDVFECLPEQSLTQVQLKSLVLLAAAVEPDELCIAAPTKTFGIIEFCCDENSEIGKACERKGIPCLRITKDDPCQERKTIQKCLEFVAKYNRVYMHGSLPCTAWSLLQYLNIHLHGLPFARRLNRARLLSLLQVACFLRVALAIQTKGGTVSFEWPKSAEGWKQPLVEEMIERLHLKTALCDGCAVGVHSKKTGQAILKPWRIETNNDVLRDRLNEKRCTKDHPHTPCEGGEALGSGHYPKEFAELMVKGGYDYHLRQTKEEEKLLLATETENIKESLVGVATEAETEEFTKLSAKERNRLIDAAQKVHTNSGHKPPAELAKLLRKMNAPLASRAAMELIKCSSCHEHKRPEPSPVTSLGHESVPFKFISWDIKEVLDKKNEQKHKYLVIICDATRFVRTIKLYSTKQKEHRNTRTSEVLEAFEAGWEEIFGLPSEIRHDPEGAFVSNELIKTFSEKGVLVRPVAGEAHWQNGLCERSIQSIFNAATRIRSEQDLNVTKAISLATSSHNNLSIVHGFTPAQWALGRSPNWQNLLHEEGEDIVNLSRDGHEAFAKKMLEQIRARKIWQEEDLKRKLQRAERAKHRKDRQFVPGEIVYAWRQGEHTIQGTARATGVHKGAWFGPATVLGTETRLEDGVATPGKIVWIVISDRLWRCAPQQLRRASEREHAQHLLLQEKPWTFENITTNLVIGQYRDIVTERYPDSEDEEIQEGLPRQRPSEPDEEMEEIPVPKRKRIPQENTDEDYEPAMGSRVRKRLNQKTSPKDALSLAEECANYVTTPFFPEEQMPERIYEIEFPVLEGEKGIRKYLKNPEAFVVSSLKKKRVEVRERNLDKDDRKLIQDAKGKEIREFIKEHVVARLREGEKVSAEQIMRMRWVLTWKKDDNGEKRGKARLVVLGFEDPYLGTEDTSSPTLNKRSKQILLQVCVQNSWRLLKGDVTAAFLQGKAAEQTKYALAPPELAEAMGLPTGERVIRLLKSVYGLTTAPIEWFKKVNEVLRQLGAQQCVTDPCVWRLCRNGKLLGIIGAHVDDFLICGDDSAEWKEFIQILLTAFRWTPWEEGKFKQCGVSIVQNADMSITQSQAEYLATLTEIDIKNERKTQLNSPVTEGERTQLRALLGGLQWLVTQTRVDGMVDVNLLQSCVANATVETLLAANKVLRKIRQGPAELFTRKLPENERHHLIAWSDASWANRRDGKSTGGFLIGVCGASVLSGKRGHVSVISWGTNKLKRVAKSSMSAELQALANTEDELHLCRLCWAEFNGHEFSMNAIDEAVQKVPGTIVIDAKSIYDSLTSTNQPLQLAEKRTALELLAYLRNTEANGTETRWVHGGANLADGLTKLGVHPMLREFLETSTWSLVYDPAQQAGKKRQAKGLDKLQNEEVDTANEVDDDFKRLAWDKLKREWPAYCENSEPDD